MMDLGTTDGRIRISLVLQERFSSDELPPPYSYFSSQHNHTQAVRPPPPYQGEGETSESQKMCGCALKYTLYDVVCITIFVVAFCIVSSWLIVVSISRS